jgi:uncharacterized Tic20 family protein
MMDLPILFYSNQIKIIKILGPLMTWKVEKQEKYCLGCKEIKKNEAKQMRTI